MAAFMGCPDDIILILAETAELASWKAQERQQGTLDMNALLMRASAVENRILVSTIAEANAGPSLSFSAGAAAAVAVGSASDAAAPESIVHPMHSYREHNAPASEQPEGILARTDAVQTHMSASSAAASASTGYSPQPMASGLPAAALSTPLISVSPAIDEGNNSPSLNQNLQSQNLIKQISKVFFETAVLYLASVVNDTNPGSCLFLLLFPSLSTLF